jgi:hypothetical protein
MRHSLASWAGPSGKAFAHVTIHTPVCVWFQDVPLFSFSSSQIFMNLLYKIAAAAGNGLFALKRDL